MSASGTHVDVNDAYATRLLSRGRVECGRVESNHHSHGATRLQRAELAGARRPQGCKALRRRSRRLQGSAPPKAGTSGRVRFRGTRPRGTNKGGRSDSNRHCGDHDPGCSPLHHGRQDWGNQGSPTGPSFRLVHGSPERGLPGGKAALRPRMRIGHGKPRIRAGRCLWREMEGGIGSPQPEAETLPLGLAPEPAVLPFGSPACVVATPPPPHRLALEACRPSCTLGPALCTALVPSLPRPARRRVDPPIRDGAGGIRTHGLELMRLARTAAPLPRVALARERRSGRQDSNLRSPTPEVGGVADLPYDQSRSVVSGPAGARRPCDTRGREPSCSVRLDAWTTGSSIDDRGIEPRSTAVSERRLPSRPVVGTCSQAGFRRAECRARDPRRGGESEASASPPQLRSRAAARHLAGRIRTSVPHPRKVVLGSAELRRASALGGSRTRLTRETAEPHHQARPRACLPREPELAPERQLRPRQGTPSGILAIEDPLLRILDLRQDGWSPGESNPARVDASHHPGHQEPHRRATAGTRTRSAALATPCASDLTPRSHRERPERGSNPRHRCERPGSWPTRRPGRVGISG